MAKHSVIHALLVGSMLTVGYAPLCHADVAPPDGYVEQCTVEKKQAPGQACVSCDNDYRSFATDAGDPCQQQYASQGYTKICKSWGASVWTEVWCTGPVDAGTGATTPPTGCNCRTSTTRAGTSAALFLALGGLISARLLKRRARV